MRREGTRRKQGAEPKQKHEPSQRKSIKKRGAEGVRSQKSSPSKSKQRQQQVDAKHTCFFKLIYIYMLYVDIFFVTRYGCDSTAASAEARSLEEE